MTETNPQHGPRIEMWTRDLAPYGATNVQETVWERLQQLKEEGAITDISINAWGGRIDAAAMAAIEGCVPPAREVVDTFTTWASEREYSLQPAFETREVGLLVSEETREVIVPPIICLAVYDADELHAVFPYSDGEAVHSVGDGLDLLEADDDRFTAGKPEIAAE